MDKPREIGRFAALALTACLINVFSTLLVLDFARKGWLATAMGAELSLHNRDEGGLEARIAMTIQRELAP